jgi:hydroxymethylpyrimidine/phosphomethylpyrimidine kinase
MNASVLLVAGLDPSGGAGLLADARVVAGHMDLHAAGVATALTEQDSTACVAVQPVDAALIARQLARLGADLDVRAVKVGMVANAEVARAVADALAPLAAPVVVDPVVRASRGVALLDGDPAATLAPLLERATVVTPNLDELGALTGVPIGSLEQMRDGARRLRERGVRAVLAKGGHLPGDPIDLLLDDEGELLLAGTRAGGVAPHGTGCALSTEIACRLALGDGLRAAVSAACERIRARIAGARTVGRGRPFLSG